MNIPILGICGGHQALALAFGGKVGPIRAGEDDCMPYTRERQGGVVPLTLTTTDPIFRGIDGKLRILESHFDEVKVLPPGFVLLASDKLSPNQVMRHPTKPVYGVQGHPESSTVLGLRRILIRNFRNCRGSQFNSENLWACWFQICVLIDAGSGLAQKLTPVVIARAGASRRYATVPLRELNTYRFFERRACARNAGRLHQISLSIRHYFWLSR
jgi:hypothetical protein